MLPLIREFYATPNVIKHDIPKKAALECLFSAGTISYIMDIRLVNPAIVSGREDSLDE